MINDKELFDKRILTEPRTEAVLATRFVLQCWLANFEREGNDMTAESSVDFHRTKRRYDQEVRNLNNSSSETMNSARV
jgi:hypothetical protein